MNNLLVPKYQFCEKRSNKPKVNQEVCSTCIEDCQFAQEGNQELTVQESTQLEELEVTIEKNLKSFYEVGSALLIIRDQKLYRETHGTFEDYCKDRWDFSRGHAYRLMDSATIINTVSPIGDILPATESQTRPLAKLDPQKQREVWQKAVETAPKGKITARHVEKVVKMTTRIEEQKLLKTEEGREIDEIKEDSDNLFQLKLWWRRTNKKDRKIFIEWINN